MSQRNTSSRESGFALILALLALVLLTTMGLALSNSTSIELQISTNQRWSESARFNAEAGIEYGKALLMAQPTWDAILPEARPAAAAWAPKAWTGAASAPTQTGNYANSQPLQSPWSATPPPGARSTRSFENWKCDTRGYGMGYGVIFDDGGAAGAQEYQSQVGGATLNGAYTLWLRRPVMWSLGNGTGTTLQDYPGNDVLTLVAEGVAPYTGAAANAATSAFTATNRAVYTIEVLLSRSGTTILDQSACSSRQGQAGGSSSGSNSGGCIALKTSSQITEALVGSNDQISGNLGNGLLK